MATPTVEVGQIWIDNDSRYRGEPLRRVRVVSVAEGDAALVENCATGRRSIIAFKRFKPTASGYRLETTAPPVELKAKVSFAIERDADGLPSRMLIGVKQP
jgi:hypothetical protein